MVGGAAALLAAISGLTLAEQTMSAHADTTSTSATTAWRNGSST